PIDLFAVGSVRDCEGVSVVLRSVIVEGMASSRSVVSTRLDGIPELMIDGETSLLVSAADTTALTEALQKLLCDRELRVRYGCAGRARIERHFRIEHTVAPLLKLFEQGCSRRPVGDVHASHSEAATEVAYLIDRWPDNDLP